jgi:hypothetical protein
VCGEGELVVVKLPPRLKAGDERVQHRWRELAAKMNHSAKEV